MALTTRLEARVIVNQKELLRQAATAQGLTLTAFVTSSAREAAIKVLRELHVIERGRRTGGPLPRQCLIPMLRTNSYGSSRSALASVSADCERRDVGTHCPTSQPDSRPQGLRLRRRSSQCLICSSKRGKRGRGALRSPTSSSTRPNLLKHHRTTTPSVRPLCFSMRFPRRWPSSPPSAQLPTTLTGRLAVSSSHQGNGFGGRLL